MRIKRLCGYGLIGADQMVPAYEELANMASLIESFGISNTIKMLEETQPDSPFIEILKQREKELISEN